MQKTNTWRYYDVAVALFVASLLTANIIAVKLIEIGPLILPAGVVIFPVSYILGDILTEVCQWVMSAAKIPVWAKMTPNITHIEEPSRAALAAAVRQSG